MASNVRQNRTLEAYCCLRGLPEASFASKNEVTSAFCLAPLWFAFLFPKQMSSKLHFEIAKYQFLCILRDK